MAATQNDRDVLLQAASPRVVPIPIPMDQVDGLEDALDQINQNMTEISSVLNNTKSLTIMASATTFVATATGFTTPSQITLTAKRGDGLTAAAAWSVAYGSASLGLAGDTCTVTGTTVSGASVTILCRVVQNGKTHDAYVTIAKLGALAAADKVNLTSQVVGLLDRANTSGFGVLAALNQINLGDASQTAGQLNGQTKLTNMGELAYANTIVGEKVVSGTIGANVGYLGKVYASQVNSGSFVGQEFSGGTFTGGIFRTAASGARIQISASDNSMRVYNGSGLETMTLNPNTGVNRFNSSSGQAALEASNSGSGEGINLYSASGYGAKVQSGSNHGVYAIASSNNMAALFGYATGYAVGVYGRSTLGFGAVLESQAGFPLWLVPTTNLNIPQAGAVSMHPTHGLIICNGTSWLKPAGGWAAI